MTLEDWWDCPSLADFWWREVECEEGVRTMRVVSEDKWGQVRSERGQDCAQEWQRSSNLRHSLEYFRIYPLLLTSSLKKFKKILHSTVRESCSPLILPFLSFSLFFSLCVSFSFSLVPFLLGVSLLRTPKHKSIPFFEKIDIFLVFLSCFPKFTLKVIAIYKL